MTYWLPPDDTSQRWLLDHAPPKTRPSTLKFRCSGPHRHAVNTGDRNYKDLGVRYEEVGVARPISHQKLIVAFVVP